MCPSISISECNSQLCQLILSVVPELYQAATYKVSEDGSFEIVDEKTADKVKMIQRTQSVCKVKLGLDTAELTEVFDRYLEILHCLKE